MNRLLRGVLGLLLFTPALVCAQGGDAPARKRGAIYGSEVDLLVDVLRDTARTGGLPALGGDSVLSTAKVLTAMGHCHRRYHRGDGPVVRPSLDLLLRSRAADGSFGDAATTAWVVDALTAMDADGFREEVQQANAWLGRQGAPAAPFQALVSQVLASVRADVWPQMLAKAAAERATASHAAPASLQRDAAADDLVRMVACQVANKHLDRAQDPKAAAPAAVFSPAQARAFTWLFAQQQDGVFSVAMGGKSFPSVELTGFGLLALQSKPQALRSAAEQAALDQGLQWLLARQNEDGTFGDRVPNYTTCVVTAALVKWGSPLAKDALAKAQRSILAFQNIESGGYQRSDRDYGSIGYGSSQRGDLSNLHFSLEALRATGLPADHEAFAKALVFLQRTQNLKSVNDFSGKVPDPERDGVMLDAASGDDGGAGYYPGNSNAGYIVLPDGKSVPRSYGTMTYALLKSYTLAGVTADDPRVQAAVKWIEANWDLATNPGADAALGEKAKYQGLFYYYMVLAQALDVVGLKTVKVAGEPNEKGEATTTDVDWRQALRAQLEGMQGADGTWVNGKNDRWMEGMQLLCTCYAMVALERCR
jgi:hypothetical protein